MSDVTKHRSAATRIEANGTAPPAADAMCRCDHDREDHLTGGQECIAIVGEEFNGDAEFCPCNGFAVAAPSETPHGASVGGSGAQPPSVIDWAAVCVCGHILDHHDGGSLCRTTVGWKPDGFTPIECACAAFALRVVPAAIVDAYPGRCPHRIRVPGDPNFRGWRCTARAAGAHEHAWSVLTEEAWEQRAVDGGNFCRECGCTIDVEQPVYTAPGGAGVRCAQCELADVFTPTGARGQLIGDQGSLPLMRVPYEAPTLTPIGNISDAAVRALLPDNLTAISVELARVSMLRTSELLRLAATELEAAAIPGAAAARAAAVANELRVRAGAVEGQAADVIDRINRYGERGAYLDILGVLREIGEVRL